MRGIYNIRWDPNHHSTDKLCSARDSNPPPLDCKTSNLTTRPPRLFLTTSKIRKLLNNNDVGELNALIDENIARKATVECLQTEHLEMENVVIRKDETIIYKTY